MSGRQQCIVQIEISAPSQLREHEVNRGEDAHAQLSIRYTVVKIST